jgi:hypothetical protein
MGRARMRWAAVPIGVTAIAALCWVAAAGATPVTVLAGNMRITINGHTNPMTLPRMTFAPIGFHGSASLATRDGSHVPAALGTRLLIDKHIGLDTTGLPACSLGEIEARKPAEAIATCGDALIGRGTSTAEVQFPEQASFDATGPLLAFNGPAEGGRYGGYNEQLYYVYVAVPVPTALIAVGKVSRASGKYGYEITISIPTIAGGAGSLKSTEFEIGRKWAYRRAKYSFLNAECANGHFDAQVGIAFSDGTKLKGNVSNPCKALGS